MIKIKDKISNLINEINAQINSFKSQQNNSNDTTVTILDQYEELTKKHLRDNINDI